MENFINGFEKRAFVGSLVGSAGRLFANKLPSSVKTTVSQLSKKLPKSAPTAQKGAGPKPGLLRRTGSLIAKNPGKALTVGFGGLTVSDFAGKASQNISRPPLRSYGRPMSTF